MNYKKIIKFLKKNLFFVILVLLIILFVVLSNFYSWDLGGLLSSREQLAEFVNSFGVLGGIVLILIIAVEVIIAPLPGFIPALVAGFVFGPFLGALYIYIGNIIGTLVVFFLVKKYGRSLAYKFFKEKNIIKYEKAINRNENWLLFLYFIPIFPLDVITAAFGLSKIKPRKFIMSILIGFLGYALILSFFGDVIADFYFKIF